MSGHAKGHGLACDVCHVLHDGGVSSAVFMWWESGPKGFVGHCALVCEGPCAEHARARWGRSRGVEGTRYEKPLTAFREYGAYAMLVCLIDGYAWRTKRVAMRRLLRLTDAIEAVS